MGFAYPANTIWYVQSWIGEKADLSEGSAVAIRLQKKGEPKTAETYLLTCAHVLHGGLGVTRIIRAWRPGVAHSDKQACTVTIVSEIRELTAEQPSAANDWVMLRIGDANASAAAPSVRAWAGDSVSDDCCLYGYPGGEKSFPQGMVTPTRMPDTFPFRSSTLGIVCFNGDATRAGVSGGGVFRVAGGEFVGLHRARADATLQLHAVSASHILSILDEQGYEAVSRGPGIPARDATDDTSDSNAPMARDTATGPIQQHATYDNVVLAKATGLVAPSSAFPELVHFKIESGDSREIAIGRYPIKVAEYQQFISETNYPVPWGMWTFEGFYRRRWSFRRDRNCLEPGFTQSADHPIVGVNIEDAKAYLAWLEKKTGIRFRLLKRAEWWSCIGQKVQKSSGKYVDWEELDDFDGTVPVQTFSVPGTFCFKQDGRLWEWHTGLDKDVSLSQPLCRTDEWRKGLECLRRWRSSIVEVHPGKLEDACREWGTSSIRCSIIGFRVASDY